MKTIHIFLIMILWNVQDANVQMGVEIFAVQNTMLDAPIVTDGDTLHLTIYFTIMRFVIMTQIRLRLMARSQEDVALNNSKVYYACFGVQEVSNCNKKWVEVHTVSLTSKNNFITLLTLSLSRKDKSLRVYHLVNCVSSL